MTLWSGILGEDGASGLTIDAPRAALQRMLLAQQAQGMLLCLCSKNADDEVMDVLRSHPDMLIRPPHIVARRINWRPKSENLRELADELDVGLDALVFLDDSPVECAEVLAHHPEALVLNLPADTARWPEFLANVWAFDAARATVEGGRRTELYADGRKRERLRQETRTVAEFLARLELEIDIREVEPADFARVSELTRRTTQFNASGRRLWEPDLAALSRSTTAGCLVARVRDRFGDYGLVGVAQYLLQEAALEVETFLLSCRALGRGVEHQLLRALGNEAARRGLAFVDVHVVPTNRNMPVRSFFESVARTASARERASGFHSFPVKVAAACADVGDMVPRDVPERPRPNAGADRIATRAAARSRLLLRIAEQVLRPAANSPHGDAHAERSDATLEDLIRAAWKEVLGLDHVDAHQSLADLGATSVHVALVAGRLAKRCGVDVPLAVLLDAWTVACMAEVVAAWRQRGVVSSSPFARSAAATAPLTAAQWPYWVHAQARPGSRTKYNRVDLRFEGPLDLGALERACGHMTARHQPLRTVFRQVKRSVSQVADDPARPPAFDVFDGSHEDAAQSWTSAARVLREREADHPLDLRRGPVARFLLVRLSDTRSLLRLLVHHIAGDRWSYALYARELKAFYGAEHHGTAPALPAPAISYFDYARWEAEHRKDAAFEASVAYWHCAFSTEPAVMRLGRECSPARKPIPAVEYAFDRAALRALQGIASSEATTVFVVLLAVLLLHLHRWSSQSDVLVGVPSANRRHVETFDLFGLFADLIPVRIRLQDMATVQDVLRHARSHLLAGVEHGELSLHEILRLIPVRPGTNPFDCVRVIFNPHELVPEGFTDGALTVTYADTSLVATEELPYDLYVSGLVTASSLSLRIRGSGAIFAPDLLERFVSEYLGLLDALADDTTVVHRRPDELFARADGRRPLNR